MSNADSTVEFAETTSDSSGSYHLQIDTDEITLPDSIRLTATDIDGAENGSFASKDTLLYCLFLGWVKTLAFRRSLQEAAVLC